MRRNNTLFMILLRLALALIIGTITYFVIKDIRKDMGIDDNQPPAYSTETGTVYEWAYYT
ncbi:MAG: hypothetical protein IK097_08645 [Clostridia bacterium]|nr:hypothetical protein [Clostridia bacterium]